MSFAHVILRERWGGHSAGERVQVVDWLADRLVRGEIARPAPFLVRPAGSDAQDAPEAADGTIHRLAGDDAACAAAWPAGSILAGTPEGDA